MNKNIFIMLFLFFFLIILIIINVSDAKNKLNEYSRINNEISSLLLLDKDLDMFLSNKLIYKNYDKVDKIKNDMKKNISNISDNNILKNELKDEFKSLENIFYKKTIIIEKLKSTDAILNNSFRYMQTLHSYSHSKKLDKVYTQMLTIQFNVNISADELINELSTLSNNIFASHANVFLNNYKKYIKYEKKISDLNLANHIRNFNILYENNLYEIFHNLFINIIFLIFLLIVLMLIFFRLSNDTLAEQIKLNKFKRAVDYSDNIIFITDYNKNITYVNKAFELSTGFTFDQIKNKPSSFLKSHTNSDTLYKELNDTIYSGKVWRGEFVCKNKDSKTVYEKVSISPIFNQKGKIVEFLAIKLNITEEKEYIQKEAMDKELLSHQSKMVAVSDMLESISHQWRQPLSEISVSASGMKLKKDFDDLSNNDFDKFTDIILHNTKYLSGVINEFSEFFKKDSKIIYFDISKTLDKVLSLLEFRIKDNNILIHKNIEDIEIKGFENELMQVFTNILSNSLDALKKTNQEKHIFINISKKNENIIIEIKDNAKGIKEEDKNSIFEPYFTTKHQTQGTGLGLYMSYQIILKYFKGNIFVNNVDYDYKDNREKGCEFIISIPMKVV